MKLSEIGAIANQCWIEIPQHFPFVKLGAFVIMPNHVHGIIIIDKPNDGRNIKPNDGRNIHHNDDRNIQHNEETQNLASLSNIKPDDGRNMHQKTSIPKNKFGPQSKNLASIIRGFKIGVTKYARKIHADSIWQSGFYDHIVRNDQSYQRIEKYIIENPAKWGKDKFYPK